MRGLAIVAIALTGACEARLGGGTAVEDAGGDGPLFSTDGPEPDAPLGNFGPPQPITVAATAAQEDDGTLSHDGLELVFAVASNGQKDLFYASRPDLQSAFGPATRLPFSVAGATSEETPRFAADDLTLFFAKAVGAGNLDIHRVTRPSTGPQAVWGTPSLVAGVNGAGVDKWFIPCDGNRYLLIIGADIAEGVLGAGLPAVVAELSTAQSETGPFVTKDCLNVTFASTRGDGTTNKLYTSSRIAVGQPWSPPVLLDTFAALGGGQQDPFISDDTRTFVLVSDSSGTNDLYISTR